MRGLSLRMVPDTLLGEGRYWATPGEIARRFGASEAAVFVAARRWKKAKLAFSPVRGLYVFVPPAHRPWGVVPADWFIDAMMDHVRRSYYLSFLSAAERWGAAHQAPQELQVVVDRQLASRAHGRVRIRFVTGARAADAPTRRLNTPAGTVRVATPEVTALDVVSRPDLCGGLGNVATILDDLATTLSPDELGRVADRYPSATVARLGWLLEHVEAAFDLEPLRTAARRRESAVPLDPRLPQTGPRDDGWGVVVNTIVESDA